MSRRTEQLASTLHRAIQEVIGRGFQDPRISGLITITSVKVTEDMRSATILISVLPADRQELTMHGLRNAAAHIRREAGDLVAVRKMPELHFKTDESLKKQAGVFRAIAEATAEREQKELSAEPPPEEGEPST